MFELLHGNARDDDTPRFVRAVHIVGALLVLWIVFAAARTWYHMRADRRAEESYSAAERRAAESVADLDSLVRLARPGADPTSTPDWYTAILADSSFFAADTTTILARSGERRLMLVRSPHFLWDMEVQCPRGTAAPRIRQIATFGYDARHDPTNRRPDGVGPWTTLAPGSPGAYLLPVICRHTWERP